MGAGRASSLACKVEFYRTGALRPACCHRDSPSFMSLAPLALPPLLYLRMYFLGCKKEQLEREPGWDPVEPTTTPPAHLHAWGAGCSFQVVLSFSPIFKYLLSRVTEAPAPWGGCRKGCAPFLLPVFTKGPSLSPFLHVPSLWAASSVPEQGLWHPQAFWG